MIQENIRKVKERISLACSRVDRDPNSISIICVSKSRPLGQIKEAIAAGITNIGENRIQEAALKCNQLLTVKWHMIGHLQTNKVKEAVKIFDLIQSVDSIALAKEIDKQAAKINKVQDILIEVKTSPEETKSGIKPDETIGLIKEITGFRNVFIKGLMTIAPVVDNPEKARPYFRELKEIKDSINKLLAPNSQLTALSMGMSDDFEVAIEEGANMVRIGRAIFEN